MKLLYHVRLVGLFLDCVRGRYQHATMSGIRDSLGQCIVFSYITHQLHPRTPCFPIHSYDLTLALHFAIKTV